MNKDVRDILIVVGVTFVIMMAAIGTVFAYSGMGSPITVVESKSMQHSDDTSYLGIIDTGDAVIMRDPSKTEITSFVEGSQKEHSSFGDYGDVIIYYREKQNPVIHRAILWLEYNGDKTWKADALKDYEGKWTAMGTYESLSGDLTFYDLGYKGNTCKIKLDTLSESCYVSSTGEQYEPHSGYLTKGDYNTGFDQLNGVSGVYGLINENQIKAVAGTEIPWIGCIKLLMNNINEDMIPKNSVPCLVVAFIDIVAAFIVASVILDSLFVFFDERRKKQTE